MERGLDPGAPQPLILEMRLFGGFSLSFEGEPITKVDAPRLQSLLAYLVLHRDVSQPRERQGPQIWVAPTADDSDDEEGIVIADCSLSSALSAKRFFDVVGNYAREAVLRQMTRPEPSGLGDGHRPAPASAAEQPIREHQSRLRPPVGERELLEPPARANRPSPRLRARPG